MILSYDDETLKFGFDLPSPSPDVFDLYDDIMVEISIDGGLAAFPKAYVLAKSFAASISSVYSYVLGEAATCDIQKLRDNLHIGIDESRDFIRDVNEANSHVELDLFSPLLEGAQESIEISQEYLEGDLIGAIDQLQIVEIDITENTGLARLTLPGVSKTLLEVPFTMSLPGMVKYNEEVQAAIFEKGSAGKPH